MSTKSIFGQIKLSDTNVSDEDWSCTTVKALELEAKLAYYLGRAFKLLKPSPP